jgi:hypothetical protein
MSSLKIIALSASLLAAAISSASADGFRYSGGPRTGQLIFDSGSNNQQAGVGNFSGSPLDARAQLLEPRRNMPKGGIASRGL